MTAFNKWVIGVGILCLGWCYAYSIDPNVGHAEDLTEDGDRPKRFIAPVTALLTGEVKNKKYQECLTPSGSRGDMSLFCC